MSAQFLCKNVVCISFSLQSQKNPSSLKSVECLKSQELSEAEADNTITQLSLGFSGSGRCLRPQSKSLCAAREQVERNLSNYFIKIHPTARITEPLGVFIRLSFAPWLTNFLSLVVFRIDFQIIPRSVDINNIERGLAS